MDKHTNPTNYKHTLTQLTALLTLSFLLSSSVAFAASTPPKEEITPEAASDIGAIKYAEGKHFMAVTANPHATQAAYDILKKGGSAIDAAIAAQLVLGLVEPQSSGIGGGALALSWQSKTNTLRYYDGRETAPAKVDESLFLQANGTPFHFYQAAIGGKSVGVPGLIRMLEIAHTREGKLPWPELFQAAIDLANKGFFISPRLHTLLTKTPMVSARKSIKAYFFSDNKTPYAIGHKLKNPAYAATLTAIAKHGSQAFYKGTIAADIVKAVKLDNQPGKLSLTDLAHYQAKIRPAICAPYRAYNVCTAAPPSSGITVLSLLGILSQFDVAALNIRSADFIHLFAEASKLAFADRNTYIADSDFVNVPMQALIDPSYLKRRSSLITNKNQGKASAGVLSSKTSQRLPFINAQSPELPSTTHISIVDREGNLVSMTSSIENAFGSRIMVRGFLLNNQLTDFSFLPKTSDGKKIANRVQANKRPRSSMSPTIVFNQTDSPYLLLGSPGGSRIIDYVARTIVNHLDHKLPIEEAIAAPNIIHLNNSLELETNRFTSKTIKALEAKGHTIKLKNQVSGIHAITITTDGYRGGADPRREGVAKGD